MKFQIDRLSLKSSKKFWTLDVIFVSLMTHLFPMHPFSTPWKYQKTRRFSDISRGREMVHWEQMR